MTRHLFTTLILSFIALNAVRAEKVEVDATIPDYKTISGVY